MGARVLIMCNWLLLAARTAMIDQCTNSSSMNLSGAREAVGKLVCQSASSFVYEESLRAYRHPGNPMISAVGFGLAAILASPCVQAGQILYARPGLRASEAARTLLGKHRCDPWPERPLLRAALAL